MKKLMFILFASLSFSASSYGASDGDEACEKVATLAEAMMLSRQRGVPLSEVINLVGSNTLARSMVLEAYSAPAFRTEDHQSRAIAEFKTKWQVTCLRAMQE